MRLLLSILLLFSVFFSATAQSGWVRSKGSLYSQLSFYQFSSDRYYNIDGDLRDDGATLTSQIFSLYGEYGITSRLTIIANFPLLMRNQFSTTEAVASLGDFRLDLKYGFNQERLPISISVGVEAPTGQSDLFAKAKAPNDFGIIEEINLPTGDGEWNILTTVAISKSLLQGKGYATIFGTYNYRTEGYSGQVRLGAEIGYQPLMDLWIYAKLFSQFQGIIGNTQDASFFRGEGTSFSRISLGGQYMITKNWGLNASYFLPVNDFITSFQNVYQAPAFSVGIVFQKD